MLLISENFLKYLKNVNDFGAKTHTTVQPLQWDALQEKFLPPNKKAEIGVAIHAVVSYLISLSYLYHAVGFGTAKSSSTAESVKVSFKCQNLLFFGAYSIGTGFYVVMLTKGKEIAELINGLIQIETKSKDWDLNLEEDTNDEFLKKIKLTHQVCKYQVEMKLVMSLSVGLGASLMPSTCMNILFYLERYSGQSQKLITLPIFERIALFFVNSMAWHVSTHTGFFFIVLMAVSVNSLIAGLYGFKKIMSNANQEKVGEKGIRFYKQVQIISQLFGEIHRILLAQFLFTLVISQVTCFYLLGKLVKNGSGSQMEQLTMSVFYGTAGLDAMLIIMGIYGFMADLHQHSGIVKAEVLERNTAQGKVKRNREIRRLIRSCPTLKIPLGASNFLERTSPLKFEDQIFTAVANLLLIQ